MTGKVYISGGGDEHASELLDKAFFAEIPQNGRILYIATGIRADKRMKHAADWMQDMIRMHGRDDIQFMLAVDLTAFKHLVDYSAVYIGGGDVDDIMDEFDRTGFEFILQNYHEHGGLIYSGGAGAIVLGKYIDTRREVRRQYKTGVQILGRLSVYPGYQGEVVDGWATSHDSHLLTIPSGIGVVIADGKIIQDVGKSYKIHEL